jgi:hypothetical protein
VTVTVGLPLVVAATKGKEQGSMTLPSPGAAAVIGVVVSYTVTVPVAVPMPPGTAVLTCALKVPVTSAPESIEFLKV